MELNDKDSYLLMDLVALLDRPEKKDTRADAVTAKSCGAGSKHRASGSRKEGSFREMI
jgi:hypothetical protein